MGPSRQRGVTVVLVLVALLALIGIAGLAIDTAHVVLNKARLQSALDAAALGAAKVLDQTASTTQATAAANSVFALNVAQYPELQRAASGGLSMTTQFSATLNPFSAGTTPAQFVRTSVTGFATAMSLVTVLGISSINVGGSAVAGPSATLQQVCNIVPIMMCASSAAPGPLFGYAVDQVLGLKKVPSSGATGTSLGPGNYNLISIGGTGASIVRTNFAGSYNSCATTGTALPTEPGVAAGPVEQGVNTRFNSYQGGLSASSYPPDVINSNAHQTSLSNNAQGCGKSCTDGVWQGKTLVTTASQLTFNWSNYNSLLPAGPYDTQPQPTGNAVFRRREIAVPIGDCSTAVNGRGSVNVLGFACLFLLQQMSTGGMEQLYAQVIKTCDTGGRPGAGANSGPGPHIIQLYKSAGSPDS
jgi:Flp pilus assembly protein TadG